MDLIEQENRQLLTQIETVGRSLTNPKMRIELRPDFPPPVRVDDLHGLRDVLAAELAKQDSSLETVGRINVAYPHKHAGKLPSYVQQNKEKGKCIAQDFLKAVRQAPNELSRIEWISADGISETKALHRSEDQSVIGTLTKSQIFEYDAEAQKTPFPFVEGNSKENEFFVLVDWHIEQGTTLANLASFIEHNGGHVLAALSNGRNPNASLVQRHSIQDVGKKSKLSGEFNDPLRNTKRLEALAKYFSQTTGFELSPQQCIEIFDDALRPHGRSVFTLTHGECLKIESDWMYFWQLVSQLDSRAGVTRDMPKALKNKADMWLKQ